MKHNSCRDALLFFRSLRTVDDVNNGDDAHYRYIFHFSTPEFCRERKKGKKEKTEVFVYGDVNFR